MTLTPKETSLLKDLRSQEQLCIEKYSRSSTQACDGQLKNLFTQLGQTEMQHLQTIDQLLSGTLPQMGGGQQSQAQFTAGSCCPADKQKDAFLCADAYRLADRKSAEVGSLLKEPVFPEHPFCRFVHHSLDMPLHKELRLGELSLYRFCEKALSVSRERIILTKRAVAL